MRQSEPKSRRGFGGVAGSATLFVAGVLALLCLRPTPRVYAFAESKVATVIIKSEITVRNDRFTLGDIAEVRSTFPQFGSRLREIALGYSPQVGAVRELTRQRLQLAIAGAGITAELVDLNTPPVVKVRRLSQKVDPTVVRTAVETSLFSTLKAMGATAHLVALEIPQEIEVPTGTLQVRASAASAQNLFVPFSVGLEFVVDGQVVKRLSATAQVEAFAEVLVAARDIPQGQRLTPLDLSINRIRLELNPRLYLTDQKMVRGKSLSYALKRGQPITSRELVSELVVKPGDSVRIMGESGSLKLVVQGEARGSGRVGDRILVKNLQSGLMFQAVIVDEGIVSVKF